MKIKTNLSFTSLTKALLVITLVISSVNPVTNAKANDEIESRIKVIECHDELIYQRYATKFHERTGDCVAPGDYIEHISNTTYTYTNSKMIGANYSAMIEAKLEGLGGSLNGGINGSITWTDSHTTSK